MVALFNSHAIQPVPLAEVGSDWDKVVRAAGYAPVEYLRTMVNYQSVYVDEQSDAFDALDCVLYDGDAAIGIWPLNCRQSSGTWTIGSNAGNVLPPLVIGTATQKQKKSVIGYALGEIDRLCLELGQRTWRGNEAWKDMDASDWHKAIMNKGGTVTVGHDLYLDLKPDIPAIKSHFRKSYRPLITKAEKLWQTRLIDTGDATAFDAFRSLHIEVAGRETRSQKTWDLQKDAVANGDAFLVMLNDDSDRLVGAALFQHSSSEGIYSVAAYDRSLFDKPIGHLSQMAAINHMKTMGLKWYRLGQRAYPGDDPAPDKKQTNIAFFKEGFASHTRLVLQTECPV